MNNNLVVLTRRQCLTKRIRHFFFPNLPKQLPPQYLIDARFRGLPPFALLHVLLDKSINTPYRKREFVSMDTEDALAVHQNIEYLRHHSLQYMWRWLALATLLLFGARLADGVPTVNMILAILGISSLSMALVFVMLNVVVHRHY